MSHVPPGDAHDGRVPYDDLPEALVVADDVGCVVIVNTAAERLLGLPADELVGKDLAHVLPLQDRQQRTWWEVADPYGGLAIRTGHPERPLKLADGPEVLVSARYVRARPLGRVLRVVVTLRAMAARERWEHERAELVAMVAHELRSPLTGVKGFTATLLARWDRFSDGERRELLSAVDAEADRLSRLITDLLDIARIDSGHLELYRRPTDLAAALRHQVAVQIAAGAAPESFRLQLPEHCPELWLDADKIDQVMANLIENAQRHGAGVITLALERLPGAVAVTVSDQGRGVPSELVDQIFARFWRDRGAGGTGLGLYIARGIVEAHQGCIGVGRAAGGGAAFRFTLPDLGPDTDRR